MNANSHEEVASRRYVLGHSPRELNRLDLQGRLYREVTERALLEAGVGPGMRVLDAGCGSGDVSRLVAGIVGPEGSVLGIDRDEKAIVFAQARAVEAGFDTITYEVRDLDRTDASASFDALVGRFVLMHQPDAARTLAMLARAVRPGGIVLFLESSMTTLCEGPRAYPPSPLYDAVVDWKCRVVAAAAADIEAGLRLRKTFTDAGLPAPRTRMEAMLEGGPDSPIYGYMAESMRSMLPVALANDIQGFTEAEIDTLETRLRDEVVSTGGVLVGWPIVSAWCRLPS